MARKLLGCKAKSYRLKLQTNKLKNKRRWSMARKLLGCKAKSYTLKLKLSRSVTKR